MFKLDRAGSYRGVKYCIASGEYFGTIIKIGESEQKISEEPLGRDRRILNTIETQIFDIIDKRLGDELIAECSDEPAK